MGNRVADVNIESAVEELGWSKKIRDYETKDIKVLQDKYKAWLKKRKSEYDEQVQTLTKQEKIAELQEKLDALQKRAELATYFENLKTIKYYMKYKVKEEEEVVEEEEFVDAPGERSVAKKVKRRWTVS